MVTDRSTRGPVGSEDVHDRELASDEQRRLTAMGDSAEVSAGRAD
jgi:hypothetical protein